MSLTLLKGFAIRFASADRKNNRSAGANRCLMPLVTPPPTRAARWRLVLATVGLVIWLAVLLWMVLREHV
jgi:hypothetical protein